MRNFDEHIFIFQYDDEIRNLILNYKFRDKPYLYKTIMDFIKNNEKICVQIKKYDIITQVPISKKRYKQRGYNQSSIIAKNLAKELEIKYMENVIKKIKDNIPQSMLNEEEREKNVKGVYNLQKNQKEKIFGKSILLVDDIFTTGNTVNECSNILKESGVKNIGIFTIAKD